MKIYLLNNKFYVQEGNKYQQKDILIRNTLVLTSTGNYIDSVEGAKEYTYKELKSKLLNLNV